MFVVGRIAFSDITAFKKQFFFFSFLLRHLFASNVVSKHTHTHTGALSGALTLGIPAPVAVTLLVRPASIESSSFQQPDEQT